MDNTPQRDAQKDIQSSLTTEWTYLAEGGAHLVFAYRGKAPSLCNKVLRVRKDHIQPSAHAISEEKVTSYERARLHFANLITPALVPSELLPTECKVTVAADWIRELEQESLRVRPEARISLRAGLSRGKESPSGTLLEVSLVENLLGGEGDVAVEIKPKCGFLPDPRFLSQESKTTKAQHCRFCMHRSLREPMIPETDESTVPVSKVPGMRSNQWDYCPLDLYSGDRKRRRYAVGQLFDSWLATAGSGNNFRIFDSGKAVVPATPQSCASTDASSATTQDLTTEDGSPAAGTLGTTVNPSLFETAREPLCDAVSHALDCHTVIPLLRALQQEFDFLGIEELGRMSMKHQDGASKDKGKVFPDALLEDPTPGELDTVKDFWLRARSAGGEQLRREDVEGRSSAAAVEGGGVKPDETSNLRSLLIFHGISAIFKDCSIIIRFPNAMKAEDQTGNPTLDLYLDPTRAIIKIIDLDLKPLKKANKWYELDDEIWRAYAERIAGRGSLGSGYSWLSRKCRP